MLLGILRGLSSGSRRIQRRIGQRAGAGDAAVQQGARFLGMSQSSGQQPKEDHAMTQAELFTNVGRPAWLDNSVT